MSEKFVESDLISRLLEGSFEKAIGEVHRTVMEHRDQFGGADVQVEVIGTYPSHAIVLNEGGEFFRVAYSLDEEKGSIALGVSERLDIPLRSVTDMGREVRERATAAVEAMLSGGDASADMTELLSLYCGGMKLTAEGVEEATKRQIETKHPWLVSMEKNRNGIEKFVGVDLKPEELPKSKFGTLIESTSIPSDDEESYRVLIREGLRAARSTLEGLELAMAGAIGLDIAEAVKVRGEEKLEEVQDFIGFTSQVKVDIAEVVNLVEDALSVVEDGSVHSLARTHDMIADQILPMALAAKFAGKCARTRYNVR